MLVWMPSNSGGACTPICSVTSAPQFASGHFITGGSINGKPVEFMVDTGATTVAMSAADAAPVSSPYGSWVSPITSDAIVADSLKLGQVAIDGADIYWTEGRPSEGGRSVLMRRRADGALERVADQGGRKRHQHRLDDPHRDPAPQDLGKIGQEVGQHPYHHVKRHRPDQQPPPPDPIPQRASRAAWWPPGQTPGS